MELQQNQKGISPIEGKNQPVHRKLYRKPAITNEFEIETRAGSPLKVDPMDPNTWNAPNW